MLLSSLLIQVDQNFSGFFPLKWFILTMFRVGFSPIFKLWKNKERNDFKERERERERERDSNVNESVSVIVCTIKLTICGLLLLPL